MTTACLPVHFWNSTMTMDPSKHIVSNSCEVANADAISTSSSASVSPRTANSFDSRPLMDLSWSNMTPKDAAEFGASLSQTQLYVLHLQRQQAYMQQMMLQQQHPPATASTQHPTTFLAFNQVNPIVIPQTTATLSSPICTEENTSSSPSSSSQTQSEFVETPRNAKRKRSERSIWFSDARYDSLEDEEDSDSERNDLSLKGVKRIKLQSSDPVPDSLLEDITSLLSLPQKEAAQKLGISESMLCKRFKECTRRKWPYRYLRKIEKTISTLQSQQGIEPLSAEDHDRLEELLRQRGECLAPVKIRITKTPAVNSNCSRSSLSNDMNDMGDEFDSDDTSDSTEDDYESEAVEKLVFLRTSSPRSAFYAPQAAF